jgi:hypothetical protein
MKKRNSETELETKIKMLKTSYLKERRDKDRERER